MIKQILHILDPRLSSSAVGLVRLNHWCGREMHSVGSATLNDILNDMLHQKILMEIYWSVKIRAYGRSELL